ncbi:MAG TPA: glycosyltransferase [Candidatus Limnocylindria bacterium]|nr:glycosyltransferase [Candidatus Limnocylindria bacterium]
MTRLGTAHQFHPVLAYGDAVSNDCFELQRLFWAAGVRSDLFAWEAKPEVRALVSDWRDLERLPKDALLLIHHSMGNDVLSEVARLPQRKAVVYHNITPGRYFEGLNEHARRYSDLGREQLRELAGVAEFGFADSEFNRQELEAAGLAKTAVVPILHDWEAFDVTPDPAVTRMLADERTAILVVGQILPQKAIHDVIAGFARYKRSDPGARLYLVGSTAMSASYLDRLTRQVEEAGLTEDVTFAGSVSIEKLVAYYRGATALLTLSNHEGFCVPLIEAMRSRLPIVANAAAAIPETLGDAGILLEDKSPQAVAGALERVVRDQDLRADLIERGERRLGDFSRERVRERLKGALRLGGLELPDERKRKLVVLSSDQRCGIHHYSLAVCQGLRARGHHVTFVGVRHLDTDDLTKKLRYIRDDVETIIVEHEAGIFRDVPFVRALFDLRRRGFPVVLSLHELEPDKFHHYRKVSGALHYRPRYRALLEAVRLPWVALRMADWFMRYRAILALMGALPERLVVHGKRSAQWLELLSRREDKRDVFPLAVMPLEDTDLPADAAAKRALRERLGLPADRFVFVSPGFFFPRKRYIEVIRALPDESVLVLSGTRSDREPRYFDEVMAVAEGRPNVIVNTDYDTMGDFVAAADCVVLFYEDVFQSAVVTQAVWAGLPCIFSDAEGFAAYRGAGIVARDTGELAAAMRDMERPEVYASLVRSVGILRRLLSPERIAERYLAGVSAKS